MKITIRSDIQLALAQLARYLPRARERTERALERAGAWAVREIKDTYRAGGTTATATAVRTGRLRASYIHEVRNRVLTVGVVKDKKVLIYAGIHEGVDASGNIRDSATVKPVHARALTIPLPAAKTAAGVTRRRARAYKNTFVHEGIIYQRRGKKKIVPLFVLRKSVTVPARPALRKIVEPLKQRILRELEAAYGGA